jgi:hypothetical protein
MFDHQTDLPGPFFALMNVFFRLKRKFFCKKEVLVEHLQASRIVIVLRAGAKL